MATFNQKAGKGRKSKSRGPEKMRSETDPLSRKISKSESPEKRDSTSASPSMGSDAFRLSHNSRPALTRFHKYGIEVGLILAGMLHALIVAIVISPTYDEGKHIINGISYLENRECCLSDESPFSFMHAVFLNRAAMSLPPLDQSVSPPQGVLLYPDNKEMKDWIRISSRLSSVLMFGIVMVVLCLWLRETTSVQISRIGLLIAAFSPNMLAYASIASCDIHLTAMSFVCLYLWYRFTKSPSIKGIVAVGAALGCALLSKFSGLLFALVLALLFFAFAVTSVIRTGESRFQTARRFLLMGCILIFVSLFVLNLGYFFKGSFSSIRDVEVHSVSLSNLQEQWIGSVPLPVPAGLIKEIDYTKIAVESKQRKEMIPGVLFGKPYPDGNKWFYLALLLLKPSSLGQLLFVFGFVLWVRHKRNFTNGMILFFYPVFLVIYLSMFDVFNRGIRYLLPLFPLMILTSAHAFLWKRSKLLMIGLPLFVVSTVLNFPSYFSFFNISEWILPKEEMLIGSNLDWGQADDLIVDDVKERHIKNACLMLQQPHPYRRLGLPWKEAAVPQRCTYYLSKSQKKSPQLPPIFRLMKPPNKVLGGLIEVYDVTAESDFQNHFLNRWSVSNPFESTRLDTEPYPSLSKSLLYKNLDTEFGYVDPAALYEKEALSGKCVIAKSKDLVSGNLLFSAVPGMILVSDITGKHIANTPAALRLRFYQGSTRLDRTDRIAVIICSTRSSASFVVGYLDDQNKE